MKLQPAVVNVLIDYVLKTNNNKLTKAFVETIAGQWKRSGIETASEAMDLAIKENTKKGKQSTKKKESVTPGWLNTNITSEESTDEDTELNNILEEFRK